MNRNYFGRQVESFEADLELPFLSSAGEGSEESGPFRGVFIRAPIVEKILQSVKGEQKEEAKREEMVIAPRKDTVGEGEQDYPVEVMARLPGRSRRLPEKIEALGLEEEVGDIVAVRQRNVFGTSFHPELTADTRIHVWWLRQLRESIRGDGRQTG